MHSIATKKVFNLVQNLEEALRHSFFRKHVPNIMNLLATVFMSLIMIYFRGYYVSIPIGLTKDRGYQEDYKIKLFYNSSMAVILQS